MNQRVVSVVFVLTMVALCVAGCGDGNAPDSGGDPGSGGKPVVFTTFYPTTYFAQRIAGEFAEVVCPLPEGADPIFGHPEADQVLTYQAADLVIVNGRPSGTSGSGTDGNCPGTQRHAAPRIVPGAACTIQLVLS